MTLANSPQDQTRLFWIDDAVLLLVWIAGCWPFLTGGRFIPGDSLGVFFPQTSFVVDALTHRRAPWWNPYEYGGLPVLADPQNMVFSPHTLVGLIAQGHFNLHVFDLTTLACPLFGAIALRRYTAPYAKARAMPLLGAIVFMLGGVATSRLQHVPQIVSYSLAPIQLLALRAVCQKPAALTTLMAFITLLTGLLNLNQVMFLSTFTVLPLVAYHLISSARRVSAACCVSIAGLLAVLCALPELLAVLEYLPFSNRAVIPLSVSGLFSFPLFNLASLAMPGLFGAMAPQSGFWAPTDITQDYLYIGTLPCLIMILAICRLPRTEMPAVIFVLMAVLWFVFAMGVNTPLYTFLFSHVLGFGAFRRPADAAFLMNLAIALAIGSFRTGRPRPPYLRLAWVQAGLGLTLLTTILAASLKLRGFAANAGHAAELRTIEYQTSLRVLVTTAVATLSLLPILAWARPFLLPALMLAATAEMLTAGRLGPVFTGAFDENTASAQVATLFGDPHAHRPFTTELEQTISFLHAHGTDDAQNPIRVELIGGALGGTVPLVERIAITQGYNPMVPGAYAREIGVQDLSRSAKQFSITVPFYDDPVFRMLGVRYVLTAKYTSGDIANAIKMVEARMETNHAAHLLGVVGAYRVWELPNTLPKATLQTMSGIQAAPDAGSCNISIYGNTKVTVTCRSAADATLVVGDNYAPGWTACVNGIPAPVFPYSRLFRAVRINPGTSLITMRYQAVPFLRSAACHGGGKNGP